MQKIVKWVLLITFFGTILFFGCSKINKENYEKLKIGMDYSQVTDILGKEDTSHSVLKTKKCVWGDDDKNIQIAFIGEKVVFFESKGLQ
jgi:hypothetical protein